MKTGPATGPVPSPPAGRGVTSRSTSARKGRRRPALPSTREVESAKPEFRRRRARVSEILGQLSNTQPEDGARGFLSDIEEIRRRARAQLEKGPITGVYKADLPRVIEVLNGVLATELVCVLRYKRHYFTASGIDAQGVAEEFLEHAKDEEEHADSVARRITQLGGSPTFNPDGLVTRSHAQYDESEYLKTMLREDLVAERIAIESYSEIVRWLGDDDPTSRVLIEGILKTEEEHADDLRNLLERL